MQLNQQRMMSLIQVQVIADIICGMRLEFGNGWKAKDVDPGVSISKLQKDVLAMLESNNGKGKGRWNWREEVMIGEVRAEKDGAVSSIIRIMLWLTLLAAGRRILERQGTCGPQAPQR